MMTPPPLSCRQAVALLLAETFVTGLAPGTPRLMQVRPVTPIQ